MAAPEIQEKHQAGGGTHDRCAVGKALLFGDNLDRLYGNRDRMAHVSDNSSAVAGIKVSAAKGVQFEQP